jgi:heat shock protein 1/8
MADEVYDGAVGIDLGTTYSCVATYEGNNVEIIANEQGSFTTPSFVSFTDKERLIGEAAKNNAAMNPINTVFDAKRLIGRRFDDPTVKKDIESWPFKVVDDGNGNPKIEVDYLNEKKTFSAQEISAMVLLKVRFTPPTMCLYTTNWRISGELNKAMNLFTDQFATDEGDCRDQARQEG